MERLELTITVLLVVLVAVCAYIAVSWTLWRKRNRTGEGILGKDDYDAAIYRSFSKQLVPEGEEGVPEITITPIQPRQDMPSPSHEDRGSAIMTDDDEGEPGTELQEQDLGRLYFALQYDQHRSVLLVRLIRGEDIPMERDISGTYVGVHLLPITLESDDIEPCDTSINVSFRECYEFPLTQSDLALQTLDFHICRYDRFSRRAVIGDVFLALAELGAQGIDITREVYLCRNIISSRQAYYRRKTSSLVPTTSSGDGEPMDGQEDDFRLTKGTKVCRSTQDDGSDPKVLWKILRAAVRKGKYREAAMAPDTPVYHWDSMFSPAEPHIEYTLPTSHKEPGGIFYFSGPGPPPQGVEGAERGSDGDTEEEIVTQGKRSGSFLFPDKPNEKEEKAESTEPDSRHSSSPASPLQISPAPEEYYQLVPITPFTPASPHKNRKPRDASVSWHVPETFSSRGPDVVQALSDSYSDPRIVTSATLRQDGKQVIPLVYKRQLTNREIPSAAAAALAPSRGVRAKAEAHSRITKKKPAGLSRKVSSPLTKGDRKVTSPRKHKLRSSVHRTEPDGQPSDESSSMKGKGKKKVKHKTTRHGKYHLLKSKSGSSKDDVDRTLIASSAPELSSVHAPDARASQAHGLQFEANDFDAPFLPAMKTSTQSDPVIIPREPDTATRDEKSKRLSVSLTDIHAYPGDSDVSSDFD